MRRAVPLSCLLLLLVADRTTAQPASRSPFASWAADVAAPSRAAAAPWFGRELPDDGSGRVDRARPLAATLDRSGPLVGADAAAADGITGRGSLLAIIDSGVDFTHPAFLDDRGRPRIVWYLDLTLPSRGSASLDDRGGALFGRDDLARALRDPAAPRPTPDLTGHGTRVASVAAGDESPYRGVAPGAEFVVVRADRLPGGRYDEADVADAVAFAFEAAAALGRPCVVNLSLGGQAGAHDGSSWLERALDAAVLGGSGGRAVVVAAGNDGQSGVHARVEARAEAPGRITLVVPGNCPLPGASAAVLLLDLWSNPGRSFALTVALPDGTQHDVLPDDDPLELALEGGAALRLEPPPAAGPASRRAEALLALVGGEGGSVPPGRYALTVRGEATVDAWLAVEAQATFLPVRLDADLVDETTLSLPASARGAIAVGSFAGRSAWSNHLGAWVEPGASPLGAPSAFSGRGPTADGRFKPDLAAPGEWILGAHSTDAEWPLVSGGLPATGLEPRWSAGRGTSLAAPHVAGAVALLFQREPGLHADELVARLRAATRGTGRWDPAGGFGRLDVPTLLAPLPAATPAARAVLSLARPLLLPDGSRWTELAVLRRTDGVPVAADGCRLRWPSTLDVTPQQVGPAWVARVDASRLAPGRCAELATLSEDGPEGRATLCVAPVPVAGCGIASRPARGTPALLACLCLLATLGGARGTRRRHWPFAAASVALHLVLLGLLAWGLPLLPASTPAPLVAAGILAEVEHRAPPPLPSPPPPDPAPSPPPPRIELARLSVPASDPTARPPRPARPRRSAASADAPRSSGVPVSGTGAPDLAPGEGFDARSPGLPSTTVDPPGIPSEPERPDPLPVAPPAPDPCAAVASDLRAVVDAHKRYPPLARRRGLSGTAVVAFELALDGSLARLDLATSSGSSLLDDAALAAIRAAAPFAVGGCSFTLPLQFRLEEPATP
ncbi:MAG: TonB family protein [Deltaproteobacteria bacterium]|nr:TonB family protein [Deltaproteobacteria bacterium]